jgi:hypothetical protein
LKEPASPTWFSAPRYYTQIGGESADPVTVFEIPDNAEVSSEQPGTPFLHLEPSVRLVRVRDVDGQEQGIIRSDGIVPRTRYVMRRDGAVVWVLRARSFVFKRHALEHRSSEWIFETPFFWWQQLTGSCEGAPRLVGRVGPTKRLWSIWVEPGRDTKDIMAAVAFMHRNWWRS